MIHVTKKVSLNTFVVVYHMMLQFSAQCSFSSYFERRSLLA